MPPCACACLGCATCRLHLAGLRCPWLCIAGFSRVLLIMLHEKLTVQAMKAAVYQHVTHHHVLI